MNLFIYCGFERRSGFSQVLKRPFTFSISFSDLQKKRRRFALLKSRTRNASFMFLEITPGLPSLPPLWEGKGRPLFLKRHLTVGYRIAHRYAVNIHSADDGFGLKFGLVAYAAFNWLFEDVLYQASGHVVQIDTGINRFRRNKLETELFPYLILDSGCPDCKGFRS